MKWEVSGADRKTGADRSLVVDAASEEEACKAASQRGVVVASARPATDGDPFDFAEEEMSRERVVESTALPYSRPVRSPFYGPPRLGLLTMASVSMIYIGAIGMIGGTAAVIYSMINEDLIVFWLGASAFASGLSWLGFGALFDAVAQYIRRKW